MATIYITELSSLWMEHLEHQISYALNLGLIELEDVKSRTAIVFYPNYLDKDVLARAAPSSSVNELLNNNEFREAESTWILRVDMFGEVAQYIKTKYGSYSDAYMYCKADLRKKGDKSIDSVPHVLINEDPYFWSKINSDSPSDIESVLRRSRVTSLIGFISLTKRPELWMTQNRLGFLCDALDGDSVILCDINS